jgi:hypothetical protein
VIRGITISAHGPRGWGRDEQEDLFVWRRRFMFVTVSINKADFLEVYLKLRETIERRVAHDQEGNGK